ncbi:Disease resistance protein RPM1 [Acorus gramineus]|uniref:Disease resistance protein RPM1 n=1 Tax=Acorus gramineus TaxID=55184 RepID=A0AAV9BBV5_ACOGR|nr:Disease resistance protein RPM1 [Acorus gramineus]
MAEAVLGSLLLKFGAILAPEVGKSLWSLTTKEASQLASVQKEMRDITHELEMMLAFLNHADRASESNKLTAVWVKQVREAAYEAEDIIDEYTYILGGRKKGFATRLKEIKSTIKNISEIKSRYDVKGLGEGSSSTDPRDTRSYPEDPSLFFREDSDLVGMKSNKQVLISWLIDGKKERMEISVWGMGGLGKTTLVAQVYKSEITKQCFECRAWITVSNTYKIDDILRRIIKELFLEKKEIVPQGIDTMDRRRLTEMLHQLLQQKRYLIVFDDVWGADMWNEIRFLFPDDKCQSRVMFTTRNQETANSLASPGHIFYLKPLQYDQEWKLFCKIAFRGDIGGVCPPYLKEAANAIVKKCDGLPLAVVTLAGLLYSKHSVTEWNTVISNLDSMLTSNQQLEKISNILMVSFYDLPHYLKNCFLYCSAFPEDYPIGRKRIIRLWVAEGFVEQRKEVTMEEVAEQYFNELVHRSMLQIAKTNEWGRVKECHIHDVVREVGISISKKQKFFSLGFKLLRVLDLKDAPIESIPDTVGDLFNLRYLGLRNTKVKILPKVLKRLRNLQTLDLADSNVKEIPNGVTKLPNLRHVFLIKPKHTWVSKELQTLQGISSNNEVVRQVENLTQLRSFGIVDVRESEGTKLCASIKKMKFLHHLQIQATDTGKAPLVLETLDPPPPLLQKLYLTGRLQGTLPRWFKSLTNLKILWLKLSGMNEDPLLSLKSLPNLVVITLDNAYDGEKLCFQADGFPSLKELWLVELSHLNQITMEEGAMQSLKKFYLVSCKELKTLPQGIERLTTLQELYLQEMAEELLKRMRGVDRQKISHIPVVRHVARIDGRWKTEMFS